MPLSLPAARATPDSGDVLCRQRMGREEELAANSEHREGSTARSGRPRPEIGNHSATHATLTKIDGKALEREVLEPFEIIRREIQRPEFSYAYPFAKRMRQWINWYSAHTKPREAITPSLRKPLTGRQRAIV